MIESLRLGPVMFEAPLALAFLLGLPILWFLLRATPPQPRMQDLPSLALFDDLPHNEETPDKTPWWIILLRVLAVTLALIGLARPVWSPPATEVSEQKGDVLLLIDNAWTAAPDWSARQSAALNLLGAMDLDRGIYLLPTAGTDLERTLKTRLTTQDARDRVRALKPVAWRPDATKLSDLIHSADLKDVEVIWISDGISLQDDGRLTDTLKQKGSVSVVPLQASRLMTIDALATSSEGPVVSVLRPANLDEAEVTIAALDEKGRSVGSATGAFDKRQTQIDVTLPVPDDLQARIASFQILGQASAGGVWYWEGANRVRRVGLIAGSQSIQPLLTDTYYVKKALAPFATLFEDKLETLLAQNLGAIILTDVGKLTEDDETALTEWVNQGGVLIRFAGPRMAAQTDALMPVTLRPASRDFDSALSWDTPQTLTAFPETGPFYLTPITTDIHVRRQVLAQPSPELSGRTWARLQDGTPLVTASKMGNGRVILFHVTAGPEWSDLPLTGTFVDMMRKVTLPARDLGRLDNPAGTSLTPRFWLNGYGGVISPSADAKPFAPDETGSLSPTADHPAGVYEAGSVTIPLNASQGFVPELLSEWPDGVSVTSVAARSGSNLGGLLLISALLLLLLDLFVALSVAGKLDFLRRRGGRALTLLIAATATSVCLGGPAERAEAQISNVSKPENVPDAALDMRFGYVDTGHADLNTLSAQGLAGLSRILYMRSTVEPKAPDKVDLEQSPLDLYPLLYLILPDDGMTLTETANNRLSGYLQHGGALIVDTRAGGQVTTGNPANPHLATLLQGLNLPPLARVTDDHVLTRSFYLLKGFTGRYPDRSLWIEDHDNAQDDVRRGDGISSIFITDADFASAWAINDRARTIYSVEGGERNREMAYRTGVNIVMYILTGNYKDDQVHLPSLLERMGDVTDRIRLDGETIGPVDIRPRDLIVPAPGGTDE